MLFSLHIVCLPPLGKEAPPAQEVCPPIPRIASEPKAHSGMQTVFHRSFFNVCVIAHLLLKLCEVDGYHYIITSSN